MAPKEKRRNSEKRKEKSRDAARCRRSKESEIFADMAHLLPVPNSLSSQLDKASVMRLAIAYLKARSLLDGYINRPWENSDEGEKVAAQLDSCLPQALGGVLMALSSEGDIVYLTENVTHQLGLPQVDLIGQSIYDYSHPCDHEELRDALSIANRPDGDPLSRSFFLRLKSTLTIKGRSNTNNLKSASYKVMNCTGRIVVINSNRRGSSSSSAIYRNEFSECDEQFLDEEEEDFHMVKSAVGSPEEQGHFLVLMCEPIPHPSNIEMPMEGRTFLTKHSLDMTYSHVDDKIVEFLGYSSVELEGRSAYDFHHALDNETVLKSYKTMFAKGQMQTPPYRFMARRGGYAWVQTQATLVYGSSRESNKPQAIVCVHTCLSEIEDEDAILCASQAAFALQEGVLESRPVVDVVATAPKKMALPIHTDKPQKMTAKMFQPRTADMNSGFLIFDETSGAGMLKEEPEDLTHLAPTAGDTCIPLDIPSVNFPLDFMEFDPTVLSPEVLDCFPLTGFEFPCPMLPSPELGSEIDSNHTAVSSPEDTDSTNSAIDRTNSSRNSSRNSSDSSGSSVQFKDDPFLSFNVQLPLSQCSSKTDIEENSPVFYTTPKIECENDIDSSSEKSDLVIDEQTALCPALLIDDEEELSRRAPYIHMNDDDDLPMFDPSELFNGLDLETLPSLGFSKTVGTVQEEPGSTLVKLLQQTDRPTDIRRPTKRSANVFSNTRATSDTNGIHPKRFKGSTLAAVGPSAPLAASASSTRILWPDMPRAAPNPAQPPKPSRATNTSSLLELLTDKKLDSVPPIVHRSLRQSSSVLENLLVSGHDSLTGHDLLLPQGRTRSLHSGGKIAPATSTTTALHSITLSPSITVSSWSKDSASLRKCSTNDGGSFYQLSPSGFQSEEDSSDQRTDSPVMIEANDFFSQLDLPVVVGADYCSATD